MCIRDRHWINKGGDQARAKETPRQDGTGAKGLREAHFTATGDGTTAPAHDKLVPKR